MVTVLNNFITEEEEKSILSNIKTSRYMKGKGRNRVWRYGSNLPYNAPLESKTLPSWIEFVIDRIMERGLLVQRPDHITINEYFKDQAIDWHIDSKSSGDVITVLSLLCLATLGLRYESDITTYSLAPRSLCQMSGDARWKAQHCIYPVPDLRYSIVFRKGVEK